MDAKLPLLGGDHAYQSKSSRHDRTARGNIPTQRLCLAITIATLLLFITLFSENPWWDISRNAGSRAYDDTVFDWTKVKPSSKLEYVPCYKDRYCARLEVPLDWNSTDANSTRAVLAIIKRPAEVDVTHSSYGGAVLFNPGGPGGSGIQILNLYGEQFAGILNVNLTATDELAYANESRYYDLISWDPRGVGATTPLVEGYVDPLVRQEFDQRFIDLSGYMQHQEIFNHAYEIKGMYGKLISSAQDGIPDDEHPARFIGTTSVIRDMIEIIEKHGEWREKTASKILSCKRSRGDVLTNAETSAIRERTAYKKDAEKLQYWGFSYGTIVGQTFASMYPERVGRLAIDGVVNATDYYSGDWKTELIDSEKITKNFTAECEAAGPENCAFAKLTQDSNETLYDAFERTIAEIEDTPISGLVEKRPVYVTDFVITSVLYSMWYTGLFGYSAGSDLLANAASRNLKYFNVRVSSEACDRSPAAWRDQSVAQPMILCADAESKLNETREEHWEYVQHLHKQSKNYGYALARITMPCHSFNIRPKWRFAGPFGAKTANPILILSQSLDPVTPLISAQGAASLFPGSQVVEAQGIGHCTLGYPSICAMKEVKKYFYTGKVPEKYTYCPAAIRPFRSAEDVLSVRNSLPAGDRQILADALHIAKNFPPGSDLYKYGNGGEETIYGTDEWWSAEQQTAASVEAQSLVDVQY